jgi:hypothetical protein
MGRVRSGPVYVERDGGVVSLVFEGEAREMVGAGARRGEWRWVSRPDVYVIDGDGVRLVRRKGSGEAAAVAAVAVGVVAFILLRCAERQLRR